MANSKVNLAFEIFIGVASLILVVLLIVILRGCVSQVKPTPTPTYNITLSPTETYTLVPTNTATKTPTNTLQPTSTSTVEPTSTNTLKPTKTNTPEPTYTATVDWPYDGCLCHQDTDPCLCK